MFYTYILRSISHPEQRYIGSTSDLRKRLAKHNEGGVHIPPNLNRGKLTQQLRFRLKKRLMLLKHI